jgi:hypothetical protein
LPIQPPPPSRRLSVPPGALPFPRPAMAARRGGSASSRPARCPPRVLARPRRAPRCAPLARPWRGPVCRPWRLGLARPAPRLALAPPRDVPARRGLELGPACLWRTALSSASARPCAVGLGMAPLSLAARNAARAQLGPGVCTIRSRRVNAVVRVRARVVHGASARLAVPLARWSTP